MITKLFKYRSVLIRAVQTEIKGRYAGSILGLFWAVLYPIILFFIYAMLYLVIFRVRPLDMSTNTYVIYILAGLIPFLGFSEALSAGTGAISANQGILLNTVYPIEFVPLQIVLSSHVTMLVGLVVLLFAKAFLIGGFSWVLLAVPVLIVLQLLFVTGIVWCLSILNLIVKDIQTALAFITMLLMIMSPIAYTPSMVPGTLKLVIWLNPFSYFVRSFQDLLVFNRISPNLLVATILALSTYFLGYWFFNRAKLVFSDYA